ncbi:Pkinase-domain-containing protein [Rhizophagus irregularis]|uniref:non-specific serine/threonine protein kinase n=1 Tax=Rhizophagus irregularis TaxID=588596 RepID=A0A2N0PX44_9GLOM|nr:Pkinase-domain-containing protein [Rhizophagus irregularis]
MENTKQQKEQTAGKKLLLEVDRQQPGSKETKHEHDNHVKSSHHTSSKISATLQKMFHTDKGSDTESEKSENTNIQPGQTTSNTRFQKTEAGKHIHNLSYSKRTHRMQNFFKELGIHGQPAAVNDKHVHSQSLSEKYGKPQEVIGKGAFGVVRIAHKIEPRVPGEKLFAVKEFKRHHNEPSKKYIKRLTSEFCISSSLHHINVIDTLDLLQDTQGNYCEVMEYCSGGDLYSLIVTSGGGLEKDEGNCFFGQLINGVKYLHDNGVAHRDLKPENLILTFNGCLKITDFGNAECFRMAWETQPHLTRGICGSEPYIAPEEFKDELFDSRSVDIWACGIIYMSMMTSSLLWRVAIEKEDANFKAYLEAKKKDTFTAPFQCLTEGQRELISKIIEPDPKKRITIEQIITDSWFSSIYICHRQTTSTSDSSISSTSCSINAVNEQATAINKTSIANMV